MDVGGQSGVTGDVLQQREEPGLVGLVESDQQLGVVFVGEVLGLAEQVTRRWGEMQRVGAPVAGVAAPLHQPTVFEIVDVSDHYVSVHTEFVGDLLLGLSLAGGQVSEQSKVSVLQAQRCQPLGEPCGGVVSDLGEQEARTLPQRGGRWEGDRVPFHSGSLAICTVP